jgi:hypothetical protein
MSLMLLEPTYSALADSLEVTSNKNVYSTNERVIVVGVVPASSDSNERVKVSIVGPDGQICGPSRYALPDSENNFVTRPIPVRNCGAGTYIITASYANLTESTTFEVVSPAVEQGSITLDLQKIMAGLSRSDSEVSKTIRHLLVSNETISADILVKYQQAKQQASSAIQSITLKHWDEAKSKAREALNSFDQIASELSENGSAHPAAPLSNSSTIVKQEQLQSSKESPDDDLPVLADGIASADSLSQKLQTLAAANDVNDSELFRSASAAILDARGMLASNDTQGAQEKLQQASTILGHVQVDLRDHAQQRNLNSTLAPGTLDLSTTAKQRLVEAADRIQKSDMALLSQNITDPTISSKVQASLDALQLAHESIQKGDLGQARGHIGDALSFMVKAKSALFAQQSHSDVQSSHDHRGKKKNH